MKRQTRIGDQISKGDVRKRTKRYRRKTEQQKIDEDQEEGVVCIWKI